MKQFIVACLLSLAVIQPISAAQRHDEQQVKAKMKEDVDYIRSIFEVCYAPADWKKEHAGWDLDAATAAAKGAIDATPNITLKDYQRIVSDLVYSTRDYHVGVTFHSTEAARLPFIIKGVKGRYFFTHINREKLSFSSFPFSEGDELVMFDDRPVHDVVMELRINEERGANEATDQGIAELFLTNRFGSLGFRVPRGPVSIGVQSADGKVTNYQLIWSYTPEKIGSPKDYLARSVKGLDSPSPFVEKQDKGVMSLFPAHDMTVPLFKTLSEALPDMPKQAGLLGARESYLPALGRKIWEADESSAYHAYLFQTPDRRLIGYIRIPHYVLDEHDAVMLAEIIAKLEETSDMLVLDQLDNPGGWIFHAYAIAGMLTEQALVTPRHHMKINQEDVSSAVFLLKWLADIETDEDAMMTLGGDSVVGYPISLQFVEFIREYCSFIIDQWDQGKSLTDLYHLFGADHINPSSVVRYTKPILMLINEQDYSCGDFLPAILQDNKRATLMGTRTAGAGGYVLHTAFHNRFGVQVMSYTGSLMKRFGERPIEDLGVTPDITYELTVEDMQCEYAGFVEAIHKQIDIMLTEPEEKSEEESMKQRSKTTSLLKAFLNGHNAAEPICVDCAD